MPEPDFTQLAAQLWKSEGEPAGMSATAFLNYLRSPEGGQLAVRTQTYYRMVGELQSLTDTLPAEWGANLDAVPAGTEINPLTRKGAELAYWQHVNVFEWIPSDKGYTMVAHHYTVKSQELMSRRDAIEIAEDAMRMNESNYPTAGGFISGGVYVGTWETRH